MFKNFAEKLNFSPKDGNKVIVFGTVSVYERGSFSGVPALRG